MNKNRVIAAANDVINRLLVERHPLKNIINDFVKLRNLNSKERKCLYDLCFAYVRKSHNIFKFFLKEIFGFSTLSIKDQVQYAIKLLSFELKIDDSLTFSNIFTKWLNFCENNEDLALDALGPLIKSRLLYNDKENARQLAKSLFEEPLLFLAFDERFIKEEELLNILKKIELKTIKSPVINSAIGVFDGLFSIKNLPKNMQNYVWPMDASSQFAASLIKPRADDKVLDMCTGLGVKLKFITKEKACFFAVDIDQKRLDRAKKWVNNKNIQYTCIDATKTDFKNNFFDLILLDAPCSGTGTIRRHPDIIERLTDKDLNLYLALQRNLLKEACRIIKPTGKIIYATCSILYEENQCQIEKCLQENKDMLPCELKSLIYFSHNLPMERLNNHYLQLIPNIDKCDGFFIACLTKK